jgi:hypothetical protein
MVKHTKKRPKVKQKQRPSRRGKKSQSRSRAAKKGWETRRGRKREAASKAILPKGVESLIKARVDLEEERALLREERRKLERMRKTIEKKPQALVLDAAIDRQIEAHIDSGEWEDTDETRILGRLFTINRLDPVEFDDEIMRLADEFDDWSVHDIYELWFYGELN